MFLPSPYRVSEDGALSYQRTSRHLFHENLDVSILRHGAQILNDVPVLQVLVESNLFMEGLGVPGQRERIQMRPYTTTYFCDI